MRARIDTLTFPLIPRPPELVRRIPIVGNLLGDDQFDLLIDWMGDPLSQLIVATTFGLTAMYMVIDLWSRWNGDERDRLVGPFKLAIIILIGLISVSGNTVMVMAMRVLSTPSQFSHDGGVLMTDLAVRWLSEGINVYTQDFRGTWVTLAYPDGPGLTHFPYLPFMFVPAVPVYWFTQSVWQYYDHRLMYLIAYGVVLIVGPFLARDWPSRLAVTATLALNPILTNEMIYGFNDMYVLAVLVVAVVLLQRNHLLAGSFVLGLAMATKGTVWPLAPFAALYMWRYLPVRPTVRHLTLIVPMAVAAALFILPFFFWNPSEFIVDTISYNSGSSVPDGLPIKGWGAALFVPAFGWVQDLYDPFPFFIPTLLIAAPLFMLLLWRQWKFNSLANVLAHYSVGSLVALYVSRTMNPNYLGFLLALLAIAFLMSEPVSRETTAEPV